MFNFDLDKAEIGGSSPTLPEGKFGVTVEAVKYIKSKRVGNDEFFIVEYTLDRIYASKGETPSEGCRYAVKFNTRFPQTPGNIKAFLAAVSGIDPNNSKAMAECGAKWNEVMAVAVSDENPFRGQRVIVETTPKVTEKNKYTIMTHSFRPLSEAVAA